MQRNLANLGGEETQNCWPKDSLFRYFLMMEALQENLEERRELLELLGGLLVSHEGGITRELIGIEKASQFTR